MDIIAAGELPLRPGVDRLINEAFDSGMQVQAMQRITQVDASQDFDALQAV